MIFDEPEPAYVSPPGDFVRVQVPVEGNPVISTLPVDRSHVGCVIVPMTGAEGAPSAVFRTASDDDSEVHPDSFVTVKE